MSTTPLVTAIYARLSSASEESVSIARQVAECQAEADRRGWKVAVVATDDGVSATKNRPDERPGWRQVAARSDDLDAVRSEERRVGDEARWRRVPHHE